MENTEKPSILVIDDEPEKLRDQFSLGVKDRAVPNVFHPQDINISDLNNADLVLVDQALEYWPERDNLSTISLRPANGMALAVVLREQVDQNEKDKLTAFALYTARLRDIKGRFAPATAQHVLARLNNLEWIFQKKDPNRYNQIILLADAVRELPSQWSEDSDSMVQKLLDMNKDDDSFERCWHDVKDCRVPIEELSEGGHSILFIRWLLHQVLPYPCFLWAEHWIAACLGISIEALREVLEGDSDLAKNLRSMRYSGILENFLGDRWWRGAIEDYAWNLVEGHTANVQHLRDVLSERAGMKLKPIDVNPAVVCVDKNWQPIDEFLSPMTAITLHPDHWPPFADPAWMDIETVQNDDTLLPLVNPLDQHRIVSDKE